MPMPCESMCACARLKIACASFSPHVCMCAWAACASLRSAGLSVIFSRANVGIGVRRVPVHFCECERGYVRNHEPLCACVRAC
eukprot:6206921-Pleurochrysis_carterae.AAC.6